jgi:hypothetical protein
MRRYVFLFIICFLFSLGAGYASAKTNASRKASRAAACGFPLFVPVEIRKEFKDFQDITEEGWKDFIEKLSEN